VIWKKGEFPYPTLERFVPAALVVWAASMLLWFFFTNVATLPLWVAKYHIPVWLMRHWPWSAFPAFCLITLRLLRKGWMRLPPLPEASEENRPLYPELDYDEYWERIARDKAEERRLQQMSRQR
jgi:hypothetical protein